MNRFIIIKKWLSPKSVLLLINEDVSCCVGWFELVNRFCVANESRGDCAKKERTAWRKMMWNGWNQRVIIYRQFLTGKIIAVNQLFLPYNWVISRWPIAIFAWLSSLSLSLACKLSHTIVVDLRRNAHLLGAQQVLPTQNALLVLWSCLLCI